MKKSERCVGLCVCVGSSPWKVVLSCTCIILSDADALSAVATDDDLTCKEGDRMGCGVIFPRDVQDEDMREPILVLIYFTKNGQLAHKTRMRQPRGGFFPCIAFCHIGRP